MTKYYKTKDRIYTHV